MRANLDANFTIEDDIDMAYSQYWNEHDGLEPIGDDDTPFTGTLDGANHEITGVYMNADGEYSGSNTPGTGFIGATSGATISDVELTDTTVESSNWNTGLLVGHNVDSTVENIAVDGSVDGDARTGGIIGRNDGTLTDSSATVTIESEQETVGGLVGLNGGEISESTATGDVTAEETVGGLIGSNVGELEGSEADVNVSGNQDVGGAIGRIGSDGRATTSVAHGTVEGDNVGISVYHDTLGGFVGTVAHNSHGVEYSAATGDVHGSNEVGGFVGYNADTITDSYATGDVHGDDRAVGGFAGTSVEFTDTTSVYAMGEVTADSAESTGGIVGHLHERSGTLTDAYYNSDAHEYDAVGDLGDADNVEGDVQGLSASEMTGSAAQDSMTFDFATTWETTNETPELQ